jgi:hypothetical protein
MRPNCKRRAKPLRKLGNAKPNSSVNANRNGGADD